MKDLEHLVVRGREVDVAAPDPVRVRVREMVDESCRLGIVDDHDVVVVVELLGVHRVVVPVDLLVGPRQAARVALERVVDRLRDCEEFVGPGHDPPLDVEADVLHERDQGVVDLGDAAAEGGRRHVDDALADQRLGKPANLVHHSARGERGVVRDGLISDVDALEHGESPAGRHHSEEIG